MASASGVAFRGHHCRGRSHRRPSESDARRHLLQPRSLSNSRGLPHGGRVRCRRGPAPALRAGPDSISEQDENQLQTTMLAALQKEDYALAAKVRDELEARGVGNGKGGSDSSWRGLGAPEWLDEWLGRLGFPLPLPVQRKAMQQLVGGDGDALILSQTGSGKTLAYMVPLLCLLDLSYFDNYYLNEILELQEELKQEQQEEGEPQETAASAAAQAAQLLPQQPKVQAVVVVPTFELGAQACIQAFKLVGGNISTRRSTLSPRQREPGAAAQQGGPGDDMNMFTYNGPKGIEVTGMFSEKDVLRATTFNGLDSVQILVGTPRELQAVAAEKGGLDLDQVKVMVVDEFDACVEQEPEAMAALLKRAPGAGTGRRNILCGATIPEEVISRAHSEGWVGEGADLRLSDSSHVPSGTRHRLVVVADEDTKLLALTRLLRQDLKGLGLDSPPARVMVYAQSEATARKASRPLRMTLWGDHKMTTLLPGGEEPLLALQAFRDNQTTLMLATPHHCRGLDLPAVSHVYNLEVPLTASSYVHQAGRTGRVGWEGDGLVTTIVTSEEEATMRSMASELGLSLVEETMPVPEDYASQVIGAAEGAAEDQEGAEEEAMVETGLAREVLPEELIKNLEDVYNLLNIRDPEKARREPSAAAEKDSSDGSE